MKSNYKLTFKSNEELLKFSIAFFNKIEEYNDWFKNADFFSRKLVLYVDTANYSCLNNFVENNNSKYNYTIETRK